MKILVTGAAGFIGYHLCEMLLSQGHDVAGLDNLNDYYDVSLKLGRLEQLGITGVLNYNEAVTGAKHSEKFTFIRLNLEDRENLPVFFKVHNFDVVCNLAAQAGVRYSIEEPFKYAESNMLGFLNLLEACHNFNVEKVVYASSSSVYGQNDKIPFSTTDATDKPISLYAATKKSNELMAYTYSHLFNIKCIGLRFFTVYGPWGRPDMAMFLFTDAILNDKPIKVFNRGELSRDFTYVDDIVKGVTAAITDTKVDAEMYQLYNIGNSKPVKLLDFISEIENVTGKEAEKQFMDMQPGDVEKTWADVSGFAKRYNYAPATDIHTGVTNFVSWYRKYYNI